MLKRIFSILLILMITLSTTLMVFADKYVSGYPYSGETHPPVEHMEGFSTDIFGLGASKYYIYYNNDGWSNRDRVTYYYPLWNFCLIKSNSKYIKNGITYYTYYIGIYKNNSITTYTYPEYIRWWTDSGGELYHCDSGGAYIALNDNFQFEGEIGDNASMTDVDINVPIFASYDNALAWYQTNDNSYLANSEKFVDIPSPINVSMYKASSENSLYVYYENTDYTVMNDFTTRCFGSYRYTDASGNDIVISSIPQQDNAYSKRGQFKIDLSVLDKYDTGRVFINLCNRETINGTNIDSNVYYIDYYIGNNEYNIGIYDVDSGTTDSFETKVLTDYQIKNDSYTGGVNSSLSGIVSPSDGDYSFLGGIFNGFGLLGNNGLIAYIGQLFSFIPTPIMTMLIAGVSAMVVIALFKLLVN